MTPASTALRAAALRYDFTVNIMCGKYGGGRSPIDRHPDTRFIIDHLGILSRA